MKDRLLSSIVLLVIVIPIFWFGGNLFLLFDGIVACLAYKEMTKLKTNTPVICLILGLLSLILFIYSNNTKNMFLVGIPYFPLIFTFLSLLIPTIISKYYKIYKTDDALSLIGMVLFLGIAFNSFNVFMMTNKMLLLYIVVITVLSDVFAYLIGSKIGKRHFTKISPNKTIEGSIAGLLMGTVGGVLFYLYMIDGSVNIFYLIGLTILLNISGMIGDLIFSKIKRDNNIKDFSNLIPGHGGVLDRLDSLIIASLFYLLITKMF